MKYLKIFIILVILEVGWNQQIVDNPSNSSNDDSSNYVDTDNTTVLLKNKVYNDIIDLEEKKIYKFKVDSEILDKTTDKIEFLVKTPSQVLIKVYNKHFCENHEKCDYVTNQVDYHQTKSIIIDKDHYLRNPKNFEQYMIEVTAHESMQFSITLLVKNTLSKERVEMVFDGLPIINKFKVSDTDQFEFFLSSDQTSNANKHHIEIQVQTENINLMKCMRMKLTRSDNPNVFWQGENDIEVGNSDPNLKMDTKYHLDVRVDKQALDKILENKSQDKDSLEWIDKAISDNYQIKYVLVLSSEKFEKMVSLHRTHYYKIQPKKQLVLETYLGQIQDEKYMIRLENQRTLQLDVLKKVKIYVSDSSLSQYQAQNELPIDDYQIPQQTIQNICSKQVVDKCKIYTRILNENQEEIFLKIELTTKNMPKILVENIKTQFPFQELIDGGHKYFTYKVYKKKPIQISLETTAELLRIAVDFTVVNPKANIPWAPKYNIYQDLNLVNIDIQESELTVNSIIWVGVKISRYANQDSIKTYIKEHKQTSLLNVIVIQGPVHVQIPSRYSISLDPNAIQMFYLETENLYNFDKDITVDYSIIKNRNCVVKAQYYADNNKGIDIFQPDMESKGQQMIVSYEQLKNTKKLGITFRSDEECTIEVNFRQKSHILLKAQQLFKYGLLEDKADQDQHFQLIYMNYFTDDSIKIVFLNQNINQQDVYIHIKKCPSMDCDFNNTTDDHIELKVTSSVMIISNKVYKDLIQTFRFYLFKIIHKTRYRDNQYLPDPDLVGYVYIDNGSNPCKMLFTDIPYEETHHSSDEKIIFTASYDNLAQSIVIRFNVLEGIVSVNPIYKNYNDITDEDTKSLRQFVTYRDTNDNLQNSYYLNIDSYAVSRIKTKKPGYNLPYVQKNIPIVVKCQGYCRYKIQETRINKQLLKFNEIYNINQNQFTDETDEVNNNLSKHTFMIFASLNKGLIGKQPIVNILNKKNTNIDINRVINVYITQFNRSETLYSSKKSDDDDLEFSDDNNSDLEYKLIVNTSRILEFKLAPIYSDNYQIELSFNSYDDYIKQNTGNDNEFDVIFSIGAGQMIIPHNQLIKRSIEGDVAHGYYFKVPKGGGQYRLDLQVCTGLVNLVIQSSNHFKQLHNSTYESVSDDLQLEMQVHSDVVDIFISHDSKEIKTIYGIEVFKLDSHRYHLHEILKPVPNINVLEFKNKMQFQVEPLKQCKHSQNCLNYDFSQAKVDYTFTIRPSQDFQYGKCGLNGNDLISLLSDGDQQTQDSFIDDIEERISQYKVEEKTIKEIPLNTQKKHISQRFDFLYFNTTYIKVKARLYDVYEVSKGQQGSYGQKLKLSDIIFNYDINRHEFDYEEFQETQSNGGIMQRIFNSFWLQCLFWMILSFYVVLLIYCFNRSHVRRTMQDQSKLQNQINQLKDEDIMTEGDQSNLELRVDHKNKSGYQQI